MVSAILGFALVAGLLTIIPGIDTALILRAAVSQGSKSAFATVIGISLGVLVWGVAAAIGLSALLTASKLAYDILRTAGAIYLIWMGLNFIWKTKKSRSSETATEIELSASIVSAFKRGLITNLLNPKVGVFYMAVLPQFIPEGYSALLAGFLLSLVHVIEGIIWYSALIWGTKILRTWLQRASVRIWMDRITGTVLIGFGLRVALNQH